MRVKLYKCNPGRMFRYNGTLYSLLEMVPYRLEDGVHLAALTHNYKTGTKELLADDTIIEIKEVY